MSGSPVEIRPAREDDAAAAHGVAAAAFRDLSERLGQPPMPPPSPEAARLRLRHLIRTDPDGAWIAEAGGKVVGAGLALVREGVWKLSLLVVVPGVQSGGVGRALLEHTLAYGNGARGGLILSSQDSRAQRAYARAGFAMHPALAAGGRPRPVSTPAGVRVGGAGDLALTDAIDRDARGAAHGADLATLLEAGGTLLLAGEDAYAVVEGGKVLLLAARDAAAGQTVLRGVLAATPPGQEAFVDWLTARQDWALPVVLDAGLALRTSGAVFVRGDVGPLRPYLPNGAYL